MTGGRRLAALGVAVAAVAVAAATAGAAVRASGPSAAALVIQTADLPGSKVIEQKATKGDAAISGEYERGLLLSQPYGASRFVVYYNIALVFRSTPLATLTYGAVAHAFSAPKSRAALFAQFAGSLVKGKKAKLSHVTSHPIALGDDGKETTALATLEGRKLDLSFALFRVDRVVEIAVAVGTGSVARAPDSLALGQLVLAHVTGALSPAVVAPPTLSGTPQQGQTLTAASGTWTNAPSGYAYQWQRCDASGANCADQPGMTTSTYAVTTADVGSTLRVVVTATNAVGSASAPSAATVAVT